MGASLKKPGPVPVISMDQHSFGFRGRTGSGESLSRSIAKALIWRAVAFVNTAVVSGAIVGSAGVGSLIALSDSIFKTSLMVVYDQFWNRIDWGKELENVDGDGI